MDILGSINAFLWNYLLVWLLLVCGLIFTFVLHGIQVRYFWRAVKRVIVKNRDDRALSSFQAFCTGVAARVGTGNIVGVSMAIYSGGPGAVFWMWVVAFMGMATSFAESSLAQLFKRQREDGSYIGGPAYYIIHGLRLPRLAVLFSVLLIVSFGLIFNAVQANALADSALRAWEIPKFHSGLALALLTLVIVVGGVKRVGRVSEFLVPVMAFGYLGIACVVVALNYQQIPAIISLVLRSAFDIKAAGGGFLGYSLSSALGYGVRRGLLSNEAGLGSSPNIAATAWVRHPCDQGLVQMIGVFVDTMLVCSATAAIILFSGQLVPGSGIDGVILVQEALQSQIGSVGVSLLAIAIFLFALSTIAANYALSEINLQFLSQNSRLLRFWQLLVVVAVFVGALGRSSMVWELADLMMAGMAIINLFSLLMLMKYTKSLLNNYSASFVSDPCADKASFKFSSLKGVRTPRGAIVAWGSADEES